MKRKLFYKIRLYFFTLALIVMLLAVLNPFDKGSTSILFLFISFIPAGWHLINRFYNQDHHRIRDSISILHDTFWVGSPFEMTAYIINKCFKLVVSFLIGWIGVIFIFADIIKLLYCERTIKVGN